MPWFLAMQIPHQRLGLVDRLGRIFLKYAPAKQSSLDAYITAFQKQ